MAFERSRFPRAALVSLALIASVPLVSLAPVSAHAQAADEPGQPSAADKETARSLMDQGVDREEAKDFPAALKAYKGAHALVHLPMTGLAVARVQAALGLLVEALDSAAEVKQMPHRAGEGPAYAKARTEAETLTDTVLARTPSIQVTVNNDKGAALDRAEVVIDGVTLPGAAAFLPRKVNPGKHSVAAVAPGFEKATQEVSVPEGQVLPITLSLKPSAAGSGGGPGPGPGPIQGPGSGPKGNDKQLNGGLSPLVYIGFGVGAAGVLVGAVTGGISLGQTSDLKPQCPSNHCSTGLQDELDKANTMANVANVAFGVGALGAVAGVVGLFLPSSTRQGKPAASGQIRVVPAVYPGGVAMSGTF